MARTRTTKAVAQRIDLNYFKRPTPFRRAKLWLAILAPALALVWIGWHFFGGDQLVYSSGRLSGAHAVLEKQCTACHVREAGGFSAKAADAACLACHDGPQHHPTSPERLRAQGDTKLRCAECHVEHQVEVHLAGASGQACTRCHGDSRAGTTSTKFGWRIRALDDGHEEFAALRVVDGVAPRDPGTVKLNHALHMRSIRRGPTGPMVQLECSDCHRPSLSGEAWKFGDANYAAAMVSYTAAESFELGASRGLPTKQPWSDRQLMAPVKFANACAGCHLLTFDKRFAEGVPHDRVEVVRAFLVKKFTEYVAAHPGDLREVQEPGRSLSGRESGPQARTVSAARWVAERVAIAEELLWHKTCSQCHAMTATTLEDAGIARWDAARGGRERAGATGALVVARAEAKLPLIAGGNVKLQWLPHARFDHDAHTGFACAGCHPNALKSMETSEILIPGIAVCQTCHAPGPGHASAECSECHTYHDWSKRKEAKPTFVMPGLQTGGK